MKLLTKHSVITIILLLSALALGGCSGPPNPPPSPTSSPAEQAAKSDSLPWLTSFDQAAVESKKTGKPILMDFTGSDWCVWCIRLKEEVFATEDFRKWSAEKVVLLEVDFPRSKALPADEQARNDRLAERYGIEGFPTIIFANANGDVLGKYGYDAGGPAVWTQKADQLLKQSPTPTTGAANPNPLDVSAP